MLLPEAAGSGEMRAWVSFPSPFPSLSSSGHVILMHALLFMFMDAMHTVFMDFMVQTD
jgi:hypothetical protein